MLGLWALTLLRVLAAARRQAPPRPPTATATATASGLAVRGTSASSRVCSVLREGRSPWGCRWLQSSLWEVPGRGADRDVPREGAMWGPGACKAPRSCRGGDFLLKFQVHFGSHSRVLGCRPEVVSEASVFSPLSLPCLTLRPFRRESWSPRTRGWATGHLPSESRGNRKQCQPPPRGGHQLRARPSAEAHLCLLGGCELPSSHQAVWSAILRASLSGVPKNTELRESTLNRVASLHSSELICVPSFFSAPGTKQPITGQGDSPLHGLPMLLGSSTWIHLLK